jgi:hypothetical protein
MEHQEEQHTCSNLQSLQRFCLPPLGGRQPISLGLQYLNRLRMRFIIPVGRPSASYLAKSAAYLVSFSNDTYEPTDISHWGPVLA